MRFHWLAPPPAETMVRALEILYSLGVLDAAAKLTSPLGFQIAELPLVGSCPTRSCCELHWFNEHTWACICLKWKKLSLGANYNHADPKWICEQWRNQWQPRCCYPLIEKDAHKKHSQLRLHYLFRCTAFKTGCVLVCLLWIFWNLHSQLPWEVQGSSGKGPEFLTFLIFCAQSIWVSSRGMQKELDEAREHFAVAEVHTVFTLFSAVFADYKGLPTFIASSYNPSPPNDGWMDDTCR